ncbi:unnamed protein product, partial [Prorocentrum cordatum]
VTNKRAYDWARRGRPSERAAWLQALCWEAARADGCEYAVAYFDLVKCFEWGTHRKVWEVARRWNFNPLAMRVVLRINSMARRMAQDGAYTDGKVVIILELDELVLKFPWADTCFFFDDLALATHGAREFAKDFHPLLIAAVIHMFEERLDMSVSRGSEGKAVALASSTELGTSLNARSRCLGVRVAKREKHLGVAARAGRRRRVTAISKRALKFAARASRVAAVRLDELRTSAAMATQGNAKGRSTPLTLLSDSVDPGNLINSGPILAWAAAWQEAALDEQLASRLSM